MLKKYDKTITINGRNLTISVLLAGIAILLTGTAVAIIFESYEAGTGLLLLLGGLSVIGTPPPQTETDTDPSKLPRYLLGAIFTTMGIWYLYQGIIV